MVGTGDAPLEVAGEALDGVRVNVAFDVDPLGVAAASMSRVVLIQLAVAGPLVSEDDRLRQDVLVDDGADG